MKTLKIAIFGASGYTGGELLRILSGHPSAEVVWAGADGNSGRRASDVFPSLRGIADIKLSPQRPPLVPRDVDAVFCALPHGKSSRIMKRLLKSGARVIDLGADFRVSRAAYERWYGAHPCPELIKTAAYGMAELFADGIKRARLVANPGCYPTGALLALAPFTDMMDGGNVVVDSKSGASGAGRAPSQNIVFGEVNEAARAYSPNSHRHIPEIEETLSKISGKKVGADFTPHLLPMDRGILTTAYVRLKRRADARSLTSVARKFYARNGFVRVRPAGDCPSTADVRGSNYCDIGIAVSRGGKTATVMSAIDNLVKGASGQAVQNMNLMFGLDETEGLTAAPLFP